MDKMEHDRRLFFVRNIFTGIQPGYSELVQKTMSETEPLSPDEFDQVALKLQAEQTSNRNQAVRSKEMKKKRDQLLRHREMVDTLLEQLEAEEDIKIYTEKWNLFRAAERTHNYIVYTLLKEE